MSEEEAREQHRERHIELHAEEKTYEMHRERHIKLHKSLDELVADFLMTKQDKYTALKQTTIMELLHWSYTQTLKEKGEK